MKKLFSFLLFIHISVFGQITITEINTSASLNPKIGFTVGLITSSIDLRNDAVPFDTSKGWGIIANEKQLPRIKLGLYGTINIAEKTHFCFKIERFSNYLEYDIELGESYFEHLEAYPDIETPYSSSILTSSVKSSQLLFSPSIRMELIDNLQLGLGLSFIRSFTPKLHVDSEQKELWPRRNNRFNISPNMYVNYNITNNLMVEIDYLLSKPLNYIRIGKPYYIDYGDYELSVPGLGVDDIELTGEEIGRLSFSLIYLF